MKRLVVLVLVLSIAFAGIFGWVVTHPPTSGATTMWRLKPGENIRTVANRLVEEGRIPSWSAPAFRWTARLRGLDRRIRPGFYDLRDTMSVWEAVSVLSGPSRPGLRATLPEGRTCQDLSGILQRAQVIADSAAFAAMCRDTAVARKLGIPGHTGLEGYLFPDTYLFDGTESPLDVARIMYKHHLQVLTEVGDSASPVVKAYGWHGAVTLASIVEREAAVRSEAPRIAGVFWLRLQQGIPLGADPTVRYALGKFTGSLKKSELALDSKYNTRLYAGLTPGPIANPGRDALKAAFHPDTEGGWLYFVAKDDGSREHFFARDLNQHVKFKNIAARNRTNSGVMAP
ncbi:MAG: hypothetical protein RL173_3120 [Fibrobacterota bacterium]|jgi:UPF0755 protein